jgi:ferredoxin-thioredoxin reductase catalytic subunit
MSIGPQSSAELLEIIKANAKKKGFYLNKDESFVNDLTDGLFKNLKRYGYASCPCRLSAGNYEADKDILCPCVYMKGDVEKHGTCFCSLYISKDVFEDKKQTHSIAESRPKEKTFQTAYKAKQNAAVWKCAACGHEHCGENPPDVCPVCGAAKEFFSKK